MCGNAAYSFYCNIISIFLLYCQQDEKTMLYCAHCAFGLREAISYSGSSARAGI